MLPHVSILMPAYKQVSFIRRALASLSAQSVVSGCPTPTGTTPSARSPLVTSKRYRVQTGARRCGLFVLM